ncbi:MAG: toxic anion resistance protein [Gammaproteobacteria bacterium]|nr:toxic anion resistance protein [Gammaproteobacteria bacterium]
MFRSAAQQLKGTNSKKKITRLEKQKIKNLADEIDFNDGTSILFFGNKAQQQLTHIADNMLEGVRNKNIGGAGQALNEIVAVLRGFDAESLAARKKSGFLSRWFGGAKPVTKFLQQYEKVHKQVNTISIELERHKTTLLTDITTLDRLYGTNLDYFHELELYIEAGDEKLIELDQVCIPKLERAEQQQNELLKTQELRDLRALRDNLERRIHDLRLTRQVAMQSLPSIRLVQENDKGLVNKIASTVANTIPLWRQQLAIAVTLHRSSEAVRTVKVSHDLTNQLLVGNAENLKLSNAEVKMQMERDVFDIDSIKKANQTLIDTIEESLKIADEGKQRRRNALTQLENYESELKKTLSSIQI